MMTRYEQGFIQKCAEYGIDGRALLEKRAKLTPGNAAKFINNVFNGTYNTVKHHVTGSQHSFYNDKLSTVKHLLKKLGKLSKPTEENLQHMQKLLNDAGDVSALTSVGKTRPGYGTPIQQLLRQYSMSVSPYPDDAAVGTLLRTAGLAK